MNEDQAKQVTRTMKSLIKKDSRLNINELRVIVALERAIARLAQNMAASLLSSSNNLSLIGVWIPCLLPSRDTKPEKESCSTPYPTNFFQSDL